ncbi:MAG: FecR family protein [Runella zeae]
MTKHEFDILSDKFMKGECSPAEIALMEKWADLHFNHHDDKVIFESSSELQAIDTRLWQRIQSDAMPVAQGQLRSLSKWVWVGAAAACISLVIGYFVFINHPSPEIVSQPTHGIETKNIDNSQQKVVLPDGSIVILAKNASIITDENYNQQTRTVYLKGEAFFQVKRNEKIPFLVQSGNLVTEVLGTSFRISPQPNGKMIEVSVKTGRVSVYAKEPELSKKLNGVILTPNQKALFDNELKTIRQEIVEMPQVIVPDIASTDFQFEEANIETVLALIQKIYGVEIVVANPVLNHCAFTGDLNGLSMYKQLELVCASISAEYEVRGTTVFIQGSGCH